MANVKELNCSFQKYCEINIVGLKLQETISIFKYVMINNSIIIHVCIKLIVLLIAVILVYFFNYNLCLHQIDCSPFSCEIGLFFSQQNTTGLDSFFPFSFTFLAFAGELGEGQRHYLLLDLLYLYSGGKGREHPVFPSSFLFGREIHFVFLF